MFFDGIEFSIDYSDDVAKLVDLMKRNTVLVLSFQRFQQLKYACSATLTCCVSEYPRQHCTMDLVPNQPSFRKRTFIHNLLRGLWIHESGNRNRINIIGKQQEKWNQSSTVENCKMLSVFRVACLFLRGMFVKGASLFSLLCPIMSRPRDRSLDLIS